MILAAYYALMVFLAKPGTLAFESLLVNWSIAESVMAPLLFTICIWQLSDVVWPVIVGILYAFTQPIVYQADMNASGLITPPKSDAILVTLAFLKIFLAATVLYAIGRYASSDLKEQPFRYQTLLNNRLKFTRWNALVCSLVIGGVLIWYSMAVKSIAGLPRTLMIFLRKYGEDFRDLLFWF